MIDICKQNVLSQAQRTSQIRQKAPEKRPLE